ncbi:MAG: VCBS repeat-containing protein [Planctomycetes bacterium]|nr:VCBS repeat-containing protein [Planctomycetota bacterium]
MLTLRTCSALAAALAWPSAAAGQGLLHTAVGSWSGERFGLRAQPYGDVDGDGVLDFAVGHARSTRIVSSASGAILRDLPQCPVLIGDLDADASKDFGSVLLDASTGEYRLIARSGVSGAPIADWHWGYNHPTYGRTWSDPIALADLNADGVEDFLRVELHQTFGSFNAILFEVAACSGVDGSELFRHLGDQVVRAGDLDGDGVEDYLASHNVLGGFLSSPWQARSGATGAVLFTPTLPPATWRLQEFEDVDGDGRAEVLVSIWNNGFSSTLVHSIASGTTLTTVVGVSAFSARGDFDGDGALDFVVTAEDPYYEHRVHDALTGAFKFTVRWDGTVLAGAPDSNADGRDELLLGASWLYASRGRFQRVEGPYSAAVGVGFAFGDGSAGPCPCAPGTSTTGCGNSAGPGLGLEAFGSTSITARDVRLQLRGHAPTPAGPLPPVSLDPSIFLVSSANAFPIGQPLIGSLLALRPPLQRGPFLSNLDNHPVWSTYSAGQTLYLQVWYREFDPFTGCGLAGHFTNAVALTLTP